MKLYLCGPINGRTTNACTNWREQVKAEWPGECIDPMRRDYRGREHESVSEIVELDILDIQLSDAIIVFFDRPSVGTSMEVFFAKQIGKPVVIVNASDRPLSPWLLYHSDQICATVSDALNAFKDMTP